MSARWSAWCVGAERPLGVFATRNQARTKMLAEAGYQCTWGDWQYHLSQFTGSSSLADVIQLRHHDGRSMRFEVRREP